jgi:hypothetical protein
MQKAFKICSRVLLTPIRLLEAGLEFVFGTPPVHERETFGKAQDDFERMQDQTRASKDTLNPPTP